MKDEKKSPVGQNRFNTTFLSEQDKPTTPIECELDNTLEKITKIVAHDMRENLRVILGFIDLLDERYRSKLDDSFDVYLYYIREAGDKLNDVAEFLIEECEKGD